MHRQINDREGSLWPGRPSGNGARSMGLEPLQGHGSGNVAERGRGKLRLFEKYVVWPGLLVPVPLMPLTAGDRVTSLTDCPGNTTATTTHV